MRPELPDSYWHNMAARAITLREKIDEPHRFVFHPATEGEVEKFRTEWKKIVAPDDPVMFENRLKMDGLTEDDLGKLAGTVSFRDKDQLPAWINTFRELMGFLQSYDPTDLSMKMKQCIGEEYADKIPYLHLLTPLVLYAVEKLDLNVGKKKTDLFSEEAEKMMNLLLMRRLQFYTSKTFQLEFEVFKSTRQSSVFRVLAETLPAPVPGTHFYEQFVGRIVENGWQDFFAEYSTLAKIITILIDNWIHTTASFIHRLSDDRAELSTHFVRDTAPGKVTSYQGGISDSHNHGQGVISMKFESGLKLIYKPKNLALEVAWSAFIDWLNEKGLTPPMKPLDVISKGEYGWVGFIEASDCTSGQEISDYYRRIGALIGIIYTLRGNDCHMENLIAAGSQPMLIDLESVMHHEGKNIDTKFEDSASVLANSQFEFSVFRTGLLPSWILGKDGFVYDVSGIGGYDYDESPYQRMEWQYINSDGMRISYVPIVFQENQNIPVYQGRKQPPANYTEEIVSGFTTLYQLLVKHRTQIPVRLFEGKDLRFIFRATRIYGLIIKNLMNPNYMRKGLERSIQKEMLCRAFLHNPESGSFWSINKSEMRQMEDTDFPIFWAESGRTDLKDPYGIVFPDYMIKAAYDQVVNSVSEMNEEDLKTQVKFIRAALLFRDLEHNQVKTGEEKQVITAREIQPAPAETLMKAATEIAAKLQSEAIFSKDGSCTWITSGIIPGTDRFRLQPMSFILYDGLPGVTLFLSALLSVKDDPALRRLNESTIQSLRQGFAQMKQYGVAGSGGFIGIASGISSAIYTLIKISGFLGDPSFLEDAKSVCHMVGPRVIQDDKTFDIISGSAGCILGMLALYKLTGYQEALEKADLCGEHLLKNLTENNDGSCGWKFAGNKMLSGFSHGQAGIAYALLKLFEITGTTAYRDTAERAIRYENTLFTQEKINWQDLREYKDKPNTGTSYMLSWCHGAPGIGLARLASRHIFNNQTVETDIRNAIRATRASSINMGFRDHLCCGNMGLADILLYFAARTGDRALMTEAGKKTNQVLQIAEKEGHYDLSFGSDEGMINPGFFQGISGIGYALLRQAYPDRFPSVLIFE